MLVVEDSKVVSVSLYRNAAVLRRRFEVELPEGDVEVKVDNLETSLHPDSIRIYSEPVVSVKGFEFFTYKKLLREILRDEERKLRQKIRELEDVKFRLEAEIRSLKAISSSLNFSFLPLMVGYTLGSVFGRADAEGLRESLSTLMEERKKNISLLSGRVRKLEEVKGELESLKSRLEKISGETMKVGALTMDLSSKGGEVTFEMAYAIDRAFWSPAYDVMVEEGKVRLLMLANVVQNTPYKWEDVSLTISSKPVARAMKPEPSPWYIEPYVPRRARATLMKMVEEAEFREELEEVEMAMEMAEMQVGEYVTYAPKGLVTIEPNKPRRIALEELEFDSKIRYVWDAYTQPGFVSIVEFKNAERPLLPGKYRVYKKDLFIGTGNLPLISPKQKVELALTTEERLETRRELILREEERKGVLKGKAYIRMGYRLTIVNHKGKEVDVRVYDRIPVPKHPDVHVEMDRSEPKPDKVEMGILEWNFKIKPDEERKITYYFTIKYPPELSLSIP